MNRTYFTLLLLTMLFRTWKANAQYTAKDLCRPDAISLSGRIYTFGYIENGKSLSLKVQRLSAALASEKEISVELGNYSCSSLYNIQADTLHGYLNLMIQEVNNDKTCRILRFDRSLRTVADIPNADITRVNTFTAYDKEVSYYKNELYLVRPFSKDSVNHFFLQKYTLKDSSKVFEYTYGWQINFGKQEYHRCHIIRTDDHFVYLFANVIKGSKEGQWILFIDTKRGEIIHSERLNEENEGYVFLYGAHHYDPKTGSICVAGYKLKRNQVAADYTKIDFTVGKSKTAPVFICTFDSSGFVTERMDDCVAVPTDIEREKEFKQYLFKINKLQYANNQYNLLTEVIASPGTGNVFKTYGFNYTVLEHNPENVLKTKSNTFVCTYRDSKNKDAKSMFNIHELNIKKNVDEILYKPAVSGPFKNFSLNIQFSGDKIAGYSAYSTKKETAFFKYLFADNKWQMSEVARMPLPEVLKSFQPDVNGVLYFKNTSYDPETKISRGLEGILFKTF
ncbi:MAG: hypothetical protein K0S33_1704 [Bacteroidetes bacterium]|nr:hypothetical protein [Bacteroidota bacterium]